MENLLRPISVKQLTLFQFRNYPELHLELSPGFNLFTGLNAQGKTNLLESLYLLSTTRLLRGSQENEAIKKGCDQAKVEALLTECSTQISLHLERHTRKKAYIYQNPLPRCSDLIGRLPSVCISLIDSALIRGEPSDRRLFLDLQLSQMSPVYLGALTHYKRAMAQRNALLRHHYEKGYRPNQSALEEIEVWEQQMASYGIVLREHRLEYIQSLLPIAAHVHKELSEGENLTIDYIAKEGGMTELELLDALKTARQTDHSSRHRGCGPHGDDLKIEINAQPARYFGSLGQQRTAMVSIKLAAHKIVQENTDRIPLLLLDDIFSDLDQQRRLKLVKMILENSGQLILTCTERELAGNQLNDCSKVFEVNQGHVKIL